MTNTIVTDPAHVDLNVAAGLTLPRGRHRKGSRVGLVPVSAMVGVRFPPRRTRGVGA